MLEACSWSTGGNSMTPLYQVATIFKLQPTQGSYSAEDLADAAMKGFVEPLLTFLRRQLLEEIHPTKESPVPQPGQYALSVFISHSGKDDKLAEALVELLRNALNIPANEIRCTSVNGYRLPIGAQTEEQLREEVHQARTFIGLITPSSMASAYVMFELGARWGAKLHLAPLLGAGADSRYLRGPLSSLNALNCEVVAQVHRLIDDLARVLDVRERTQPAAYQRYIDELVQISKSSRPAERTKPPAPPAPAPQDTKLEPEEIAVLQLIAKVGKTGVLDESVSDRLGFHPLKTSQWLEHLVKRDLLYQDRKMGIPLQYRLTSKGRDYVIENKLI